MRPVEAEGVEEAVVVERAALSSKSSTMVEMNQTRFSAESSPPHCSATARRSAGQRWKRDQTPRAKRRMVGEVGGAEVVAGADGADMVGIGWF